MYDCPVCGYNKLRRPADNFQICPSCGTEFGYMDATLSHAQLRQRWLDSGALWHSRRVPPPYQWNGYGQLIRAGLLSYNTSPNPKDYAVIPITEPTRHVVRSGALKSPIENNWCLFGSSRQDVGVAH